MPKGSALELLFTNKDPSVRTVYNKVVSSLAKLGPIKIEAKKTSVHFVRKTSFAGAHPKTAWLDLTIRTDKPIKSARVRAQEQASKNRWHQDVRLVSPAEVDAEVLAWLKNAYALAGD